MKRIITIGAIVFGLWTVPTMADEDSTGLCKRECHIKHPNSFYNYQTCVENCLEE